MSGARRSQRWLWAWSVLVPLACQDHPLNFMPDSSQPTATAGASGLEAGTGGSAGDSLLSAGSNSAGEPVAGAGSGGSSFPGGAGGSMSSAGSGGASGSMSSGGAGGSMSSGGASGSMSSGGSGGGQSGGGSDDTGAGTGGAMSMTCQSDADCAPPTPGCSPIAHVCKQCSKSSQCSNGQVCSIDDGECGN